MDGIGRNVKSEVRTKSLSKGKNHAVVENEKYFAEGARRYLEKTEVVYISKE